MKKLSILFCLFILFSGIAFADEEKTREITLEPGYKFYSVDGTPSLLSEYSRTKSSPSLKFSIKDYTENYKYNIKLDVNEYDDYDFDIHWFYKDKVRIELSGVYFDHDLGFKSNESFNNLSPDQNFIVKYRNQTAELKYKPFLYPFHIRLNAEKMEKEGDIQKRFLGSASSNGIYNNFDIFSRKAPINYVTNVGGFSVDGLVGGLNLFLNATKTTFNDDAKKSDDLILNVPEISENAYALKLTSNQAGRISYALSFSRVEKDNDTRDEIGRKGAKSSYNNSTFLFSYYPVREIKLSLKATYEDYDQDNAPKWRYLGSDYAVPLPINYIRKSITAKGRYEFAKNSYFSMELKGKEIERSNTVSELPDTSRQSSAKFELGTVLKGRLNLKLTQSFEKNSNLSYKDLPENVSKTDFNANYSISDNAGLDLNIFYIYETNSEVRSYFVENRTRGFNTTFYYNPDEKTAINIYAYLEAQNYKSDLEFGTPSSAGYIVTRTPYDAKTIQLGANANRVLSEKQELYGDIFYLRGYGTYRPDNVSGTIGSYIYDTTNLDRLATVDFYQYGLLLGTKYKLNKKDTVKCELSYKDHEDRGDSLLSGTVKSIFVAWERKW